LRQKDIEIQGGMLSFFSGWAVSGLGPGAAQE
jgi:hypothetical protein